MTRILKIPATPVPVCVGQTRADKRGGTIIVQRELVSHRFIVEYPALDGEVSTLGPATIESCYPIIVSEAR